MNRDQDWHISGCIPDELMNVFKETMCVYVACSNVVLVSVQSFVPLR